MKINKKDDRVLFRWVILVVISMLVAFFINRIVYPRFDENLVGKKAIVSVKKARITYEKDNPTLWWKEESSFLPEGTEVVLTGKKSYIPQNNDSSLQINYNGRLAWIFKYCIKFVDSE